VSARGGQQEGRLYMTRVSFKMNWDAIGVLVEGFGAIFVVISLVYLTLELRRNTTAQNDANFR
jgi:hypothetical protein